MIRALIFISVLVQTSFAFGLANGVLLDGSGDVVRIRYSPTVVCSGVYVDPFTILTAAHCAAASELLGQPVHVTAIESIGDVALAVKVVDVIPNPLFANQFWPAYDIGIIKTTENKKFEGAYKIAERVPVAGRAILLGTGRVEAHVDVFKRTTGWNWFLRVGSVLGFVGHAQKADHPTGEWVGIAHGDSGGTVVNAATREIIGVISTTSMNQSSAMHLPLYCTSTSIVSDSNRTFILEHLGTAE